MSEMMEYEQQPIAAQTLEPMEPVKSEPMMQLKTAGFWMRFWAFVIDSLIAGALFNITIKPFFAIMDWEFTGNIWYTPSSLIAAIIFYLYFVLMTKFFNQTIGKMIFGLKVQRDDGQALDWMTVLFREGVGRFINGTLLYLPYLIVAFASNNKSIADYFADTVVVHENIYVQKV